MKTYAPKPKDIDRRWYVVDADGAALGRLASEVAKILRGKHKPIFAPHADTGDHVIVVNAARVRLTGAKLQDKLYRHHSGYPGGLTETTYAKLLVERPSRAIEQAVRGMLPKNRLGRQMLTKLNVYDGAEHPHRAQKPSPLALGEVPAWEGLPVREPKPPRARTPSGLADATSKPRAAKGGGAGGAGDRPARRAGTASGRGAGEPSARRRTKVSGKEKES